MTRNFKQHGRDDERPSSRNSSSGRFEGERSPRPARPRLNRESVDRAWEHGGRQQHPDYRPRGAARSPQPRQQGQSFRDNRRSTPYESSSNPSSRNSYRPSNNYRNDRRPDNRYARPERRYADPNSFESRMHAFDEDQYQERHRRSSSEDERPSYQRPDQGRDRPSGQSRPYPQRRYDSRNGAGRGSERDSRNGTGRSFERDARNSAGRGYERDARPNRGFGPNGNRNDDRFDNRFDNRRANRYENRPDTRNPRFQSRPNRFSRSHQRPIRPNSDAEQFEGDYEQYDASHEPVQRDERHVTRLPDGRVLKGGRREQREAAEFWTGVDQEAQELLSPEAPVETDESDEVAQPKELPRQRRARVAAEKAEAEKKPRRTRAASSEGHSKKASTRSAKSDKAAKPAKTKSTKAPSSGPRPSQKGYQWPTQE